MGGRRRRRRRIVRVSRRLRDRRRERSCRRRCRLREQRHGRNEFANVLCNVLRPHASRSSHKVRTVHHEMHLGFLNIVYGSTRAQSRRSSTSSVPGAPHISSRNDLHKSTRGDMPYLNKAGIEEEDVRLVERNSFRCPFPFNSVARAGWITMFVHIKSKFCSIRSD